MAADTRDSYSSTIMRVLKKVGLTSFTLDSVTPGDGACFMTATLQQIRRNKETYPNQIQTMAENLDQFTLRKAVKSFVNSSIHPIILNLKSMFSDATGMTWNFYWSNKYMLKNVLGSEEQWTWADHHFIQFTAWFIARDIMIVSDTSTQQDLWRTISGNIEDASTLCEDPPIY